MVSKRIVGFHTIQKAFSNTKTEKALLTMLIWGNRFFRYTDNELQFAFSDTRAADGLHQKIKPFIVLFLCGVYKTGVFRFC